MISISVTPREGFRLFTISKLDCGPKLRECCLMAYQGAIALRRSLRSQREGISISQYWRSGCWAVRCRCSWSETEHEWIRWPCIMLRDWPTWGTESSTSRSVRCSVFCTEGEKTPVSAGPANVFKMAAFTVFLSLTNFIINCMLQVVSKS